MTQKNRQLSLGYCFVTKSITDRHFLDSAADSMSVFPLYLYHEAEEQLEFEQEATPSFGHPSSGGEFQKMVEFLRTPNLNMEIVDKIAEQLGMSFIPEKNSPPFTGSMPSVSEKNSPPLEGWMPQADGVVLTHIHQTPIMQYFPQNLPCNSALKTLAREKRQAGILSEVLFWQQVHKRKFHNIDFDRQRIIGNYIVDFYVKKLGLIIEIDGSSHNDKFQYDANRLAYFESLGLKIFRCSDSDIKTRLDSVMNALEEFIINEYGQMKDENSSPDEFAPIDLLDYIYAVLHSPSYREKYKEFLKIDFPRVPYPKDKNTFWQLVKLGGELRQIHLLESPVVNHFITTFPMDGDNIVTKPKFHCSKDKKIGNVYINDMQYFGNVPEYVWIFYIGGYQPAQKWLKDRKNRKLDVDEIYHYQKIIAALAETDRLMKEIDKIEVEA
jgi:very-short-patch-repair endonuclease